MNRLAIIELINSKEVPPLVLSICVDKLTNGFGIAWEYDTLLDFIDSEGVTLSETEREAILAAYAIRLNPAYLWDAGVFQNMCLAFNGKIGSPEVYTELSLGEICWGVKHAETLRQYYKDTHLPEDWYSNDPKRYIAAAAFSQGFAILPKIIEFAKPEFESLPNYSVVKDMEPAIIEQMKSGLADDDLDENNPIHVQIDKIRSVIEYVASKEANHRKFMAEISDAI